MESTATLKLLVPLDGSDIAERALPAALALAGTAGEICLIRVVTPLELYYDQDHERRASEAHQSLVDAAEKHAKAGSRFSFTVRAGDAAEEILLAADALGANVIVMGSHGRGAIDRWRFGSVADRIARSSSIPVMVVRADSEFAESEAPRLKRLVLAHDGSELATNAVPVAAMLGRQLGLSVLVVRSIDPAKNAGIASYDIPISETVMEQIETEMRAEAEASIAGVVGQLRSRGVDADSEVINGPPGPALLDFAEPGDVLIVTSHGRGGVRRWLLGSVAEKLVRLADVPVMLVPSAHATRGTSE